MDIDINRFEKAENYTVGKLEILDTFSCFTIEDAERPVKIKHQTCIPAGRYEVKMTFSQRFQKIMPLLLHVEGFEGIRIHEGNNIADTSGCILPNFVYIGNGFGLHSATANIILTDLIKKALKRGEQVFVNIS